MQVPALDELPSRSGMSPAGGFARSVDRSAFARREREKGLSHFVTLRNSSNGRPRSDKDENRPRASKGPTCLFAHRHPIISIDIIIISAPVYSLSTSLHRRTNLGGTNTNKRRAAHIDSVEVQQVGVGSGSASGQETLTGARVTTSSRTGDEKDHHSITTIAAGRTRK